MHTICNEKICDENKDKGIQFYIKKYTILDMPLILSINTNLNEFGYMIDKKQFNNTIFKNRIELFGCSYNLIGMMTQSYKNHFKSFFINLNKKFENSVNKWY